MIRNFRLILKSIALLISLTGFQVSAQYRTETFFLEHDGLERSYEVFVPENYRMNKAYPLIFILHGGGGTGKGLVRTTRVRFNKLASQNNFIAVYPNGYGKSWMKKAVYLRQIDLTFRPIIPARQPPIRLGGLFL